MSDERHSPAVPNTARDRSEMHPFIRFTVTEYGLEAYASLYNALWAHLAPSPTCGTYVCCYRVGLLLVTRMSSRLLLMVVVVGAQTYTYTV